MKLPLKISPNPIIEAVAEIRFESLLPNDAVFGIIYNLFKDKFPTLEELPTLQIPNHIRDNDSKLKIQPLYRLSNENYIMQIGPRICSLAIIDQYNGWKDFLQEILYTFNEIKNNNIVKNVQRLALRYIDFFESDIFENIKLEIREDSKDIIKNQTYFKNVVISEPFQMLIQIAKDVSLKKNKKNYSGSIIDVDTHLINVDINTLNNLEEHFDKAHTIAKQYFFSILKEDFIKSLKPEYDNQ